MADKVSKSKGKRRIIQPSSWSFFREGLKTPGYNLFDWLHGYVYGRWPYLYIGIGTGEHHLAKPFGRVINFLNRLFPKKSSFKDSGETLVVGIPADLPYRDQNEDTTEKWFRYQLPENWLPLVRRSASLIWNR